MNRPISLPEADLVSWLLRYASIAGDLKHLEPSALRLHVVGCCDCGCPSVDFMPHGQGANAKRIADATGETSGGVRMGIILWELDGKISGLELYEMDGRIQELPVMESLQPSTSKS